MSRRAFAPVPVWVGTACGAVGAAVLGLAAVFARLAYAGGMDTLSLLAIRFAVMTAALFAAAAALGLPLRLPRPLWPAVAAVGAVFALSTYGYIGALAYIPVSLSMPIIYTYPLIVAALARLTRGEPFSPAKWCALVVALVGVGVMLGFSFGGFDPRGIALAALGAVTFALLTVGGARLMRAVPVPVLVAYMSALAATGFAVAGLAAGGLSLPATALGWIGAAGVTAAFLFGFTGFFVAVKTIGETRSAVISNLEPVSGVLVAIVALGETPTPAVATGAALVLAGIVLLVAEDARLRRRAAAPAAGLGL